MAASGSKEVFNLLTKLQTEYRNPLSRRVDTASTHSILSVINNADRSVAEAVRQEIPYIAKAVELVVHAFKEGGRLIYVGAGTSGRIGVIDAAECPPTFGTPPRMVQAVIAGGRKAVFRSQEGAEDRAEEGKRAMNRLGVGEKDVVCGIAASIRTPYVVSAIIQAKKLGARTVYVTTNPRSRLRSPVFARLRKSLDAAICPAVGAEVIMGSTRMKSGTAQKLVLNMITTAAMIRLGKVYENMMVDLKMSSRKLQERAKRVLMIATGVDYVTASRVLKKAGGHVKTAIVMVKTNTTPAEARRRLVRADGFVRKAISMKS